MDHPDDTNRRTYSHSGDSVSAGTTVQKMSSRPGQSRHRITVNGNPNYGKNMNLTYKEFAEMGIKNAHDYDMWLNNMWKASKLVDQGKSAL